MGEGKYLGVIEPIRGKWHWPYSRMQEGDYFHVDHADRSYKQVSHMTTVRAAQLMMAFSFKSDDPDKPGYCRVTCVPPAYARPEEKKTADINIELFSQRISEWYGISHNDAGIGGPRQRFNIPAVEVPKFERITVTNTDRTWTFGYELDENGFTHIPLEAGYTCASWEKRGERRPAIVTQAAPQQLIEKPKNSHPVDHMFASPEEQAEYDAARWRKQDAAIAAEEEQMIAELGLE